MTLDYEGFIQSYYLLVYICNHIYCSFGTQLAKYVLSTTFFANSVFLEKKMQLS